MKALQLLILFSIIVLSFTTCKRYPEGGWSNVAIKHLFGGNHDNSSKTWKLKLYEVDGIDSTSFITPGNGYTNFENDLIDFKIKSKREREYYANSKVLSFSTQFDSKKKTLTFNGGANYGTNPYPYQCNLITCERFIFNPHISNPVPNWKIIKLTTSELIINTTQHSVNYIIKLTH